MKRIFCLLLIIILLSGCSGEKEELNRAMELRADWLVKQISFDAQITTDYGQVKYTFAVKCQADTAGNMTFTVKEPQTIAGITGSIGANGGKLTFDQTALAFDLMADGLLTPVSAPWVLVKTLRSGYLSSCSMEGEDLRLAIDDSYEEDALHLEIWIGSDNAPKSAEIYWQGRRLLTMTVSNFVIS